MRGTYTTFTVTASHTGGALAPFFILYRQLWTVSEGVNNSWEMMPLLFWMYIRVIRLTAPG